MSSFASFSEPGFWLVIAFVAAVVLLVARHYVAAPWRAWLAPAYWFFIPYLALLVGAVSPRLMGLYWIDWRTTFQVGAGLLLVIGMLAVLAWLFVLPRAESSPGRSGSQRMLWIGLAGAEEWFWCFLRAALWEIALAAPQARVAPLYLAVWGAALLALPLVLLLQENGRLRLVKTVHSRCYDGRLSLHAQFLALLACPRSLGCVVYARRRSRAAPSCYISAPINNGADPPIGRPTP